MFKNFLSLPNHSIRVCVKGKRINRGVGYGLEIPTEYIFYGNGKAVQWAKRTSDGVKMNGGKEMVKIESFFKKDSCLLLNFWFILDCPLLGGNFHRDNPNRTSTFCLLMRCVCYFYPLFRGFFMRDLYELCLVF